MFVYIAAIQSTTEALAETVPNVPNASAESAVKWRIARHAERDTPQGNTYEAVLEVPDLALSVPLMECVSNPSDIHAIDQETLKVGWLEPRSVLWIHWCTVRLSGSGGYRAEAHVIVSLTSRPAQELLRESFLEWGKQGVGNYQQTKVSYSLVRPESGGITLQRSLIYDASNRDFRTPVPLSVPYGTGYWIRQFRIEQESLYRFDLGERLGKYAHCQHRAWLDLSAPPIFDMDIAEYKAYEYPLQEVAEFLVLYLCPRYGQSRGMGMCLPEERAKMQAELLKLNPALAPDEGARTKIEIPLLDSGAIIEPLAPDDDFFPFR
jgi:hypothetical protein